jgi:ribosomal protein S18 acetylase RimI-like enzyme
VHVDTWRATYRGIVPDAHLNGLSYHESGRLWQSGSPTRRTRAACSWLRTTARSSGSRPAAPENPSRDLGDYEGELETLYVPPSRQGIGAGRRLARRSMLLWVFADNGPAQRFYESLGGVLVAEDGFELGGA